MGHVQRNMRQRVAHLRLTRDNGVCSQGDRWSRCFLPLGADAAGCGCEGLGPFNHCVVAQCAQPTLLLSISRGYVGVPVEPAGKAAAPISLTALPVL